jgi:hypothetical protein
MCDVNSRINEACGLEQQITVICGDAIALDIEGLGLVGNVDVIITAEAMLFVEDKESLWGMCHRALR